VRMNKNHSIRNFVNCEKNHRLSQFIEKWDENSGIKASKHYSSLFIWWQWCFWQLLRQTGLSFRYSRYIRWKSILNTEWWSVYFFERMIRKQKLSFAIHGSTFVSNCESIHTNTYRAIRTGGALVQGLKNDSNQILHHASSSLHRKEIDFQVDLIHISSRSREDRSEMLASRCVLEGGKFETPSRNDNLF
jgi:hypothetical protein